MIIVNFRSNRGDIEFVTKTVWNTYVKMLQYALGKRVLGNQLKFTSGRFASAFSLKVRAMPSGGASVMISVDEKIAPEADWIINNKSYDLKPSLLKGAKIGKNGIRYRDIPIKDESSMVNNPDIQSVFDASQSKQTSVSDTITNLIASIYHNADNPNNDPFDIRSSDRNKNRELERIYRDINMQDSIMSNIRNDNAGIVKFRRVSSDSPAGSWMVNSAQGSGRVRRNVQSFSVIQKLADSLKSNLRG